ncbi:hypothetical protein CW751_10115 [Brumimicrobium salinarum]|uniref:Uncharacterized protein n=1 Tax=Brumimicrobium salinarum TaxID=2058658 RepID=A0A2I0R1I2_9FLAO|nr:T9SS type A sorting domain-containing protein [Brumimicrobium salinarum]PKR80415.1 hypothetical protein CW751_10115 [Brumimicrobium salinarum]
MKYIFILFFTVSTLAFAQDETLSIVSYNLLNFPDGRDDCGYNTVVPNRADTLKKITDYLQPDIFVACEVQTQAGVDAVLNDALNGNGNTNYAAALFSGSGYLHNAMFYNTDKLVLKEQHVVVSSPRDIDHYVLYLKDPNLSVFYDTTFIEVFMMHLKAGNSTSSEAQRETQTQVLMDYIATRPTDRNIFVGGDMNVYSSNDDGYKNLTSGPFALKDPINMPGDWNNTSSYSEIHTQSTRLSQNYDCGSKGGMDDRFDQILVSQNVMNNTDNIEYQTGSYRAVGNDGNHYNSNLMSGSNSMYPRNVVRALYYMSDHLPVELKVDVTYPTENGLALVPSQEKVSCNGGSDGEASITPNLGQAPYTYLWDANANNQTTATATNLSAGTYCVTVTDDLGETDAYCVTVSQPEALMVNSFVAPDPNGNCDGSIQLIVAGGVSPYSYAWTQLSGNNQALATDLCAGTYEVVVTDAAGCEFVIEKTVNGTTGISVEKNEKIRLYPNPVQDKLTIQTDKQISDIRIMSVLGKEMQIQYTEIEEGLYELNTRSLAAGTYIVLMEIDRVMSSFRIVIQ